jgi:hypothetical protein
VRGLLHCPLAGVAVFQHLTLNHSEETWRRFLFCSGERFRKCGACGISAKT